MIAKLILNVLISNIGQNLSLVIAMGAGAIVYFVMIYFMRIKEVDTMVQAVKKKVKRVPGT